MQPGNGPSDIIFGYGQDGGQSGWALLDVGDDPTTGEPYADMSFFTPPPNPGGATGVNSSEANWLKWKTWSLQKKLRTPEPTPEPPVPPPPEMIKPITAQLTHLTNYMAQFEQHNSVPVAQSLVRQILQNRDPAHWGLLIEHGRRHLDAQEDTKSKHVMLQALAEMQAT